MTKPDAPSATTPERLEPTLMRFIWRYSARQQLALLGITLLSFPILYASLELPKRILNDAIGGTVFPLQLFGFEVAQVPFLLLLCFAFLLTLLLSGLIKMRLNVYKGVVGERLLRRLRYRLINHMLRFPTSRFRRTSQGELVSMVTAEVEPLSGIMGDALAHPLFQAGQMLTILTFLFVQNPWFGLAAVAMVPLQAIITPILQRRINRLHRERVGRVRKLSEMIGETVQGLEDLRVNGGVPYGLALFSHRLGGIFRIREAIFRKKFFMKFLNNFINNLPPFFFYSVGGYLVIQGSLTVGALVAAVAANKDILAPWRELLGYISQMQETSDRYRSLVDQFQPEDLMLAHLVEDHPAEIHHLRGPIRLDDVSVVDDNGTALLSDINLEIPAGALVAVESRNSQVRRTFAQLLTRGINASRGGVNIAGHDLGGLHQAVIAARIGLVTSTPYLFNASVGENVYMPLRANPYGTEPPLDSDDPDLREALASGNSIYPVNVEWLDLQRAGFKSSDELQKWWLQLVEAMGSESYLLQRSLDAQFDPADRPSLAAGLVELRQRVRTRLEQENLLGHLQGFSRTEMHGGLTLAENLLFAVHTRSSREERDRNCTLLGDWFRKAGFGPELEQYAGSLLETLVQTFASVGPQHPLFQRLSCLTPENYRALEGVYQKQQGRRRLNAQEHRLWLMLPFIVTPEQLNIPLPRGIAAAALAVREDCIARFGGQLQNHYRPLDETEVNPGLSVLENVLFGRIGRIGETREKSIRALVAEEVQHSGLRAPLSLLLRSIPAGIGGSELPPTSQERFAFLRAAVKRPDILILDQAMATHDKEQRRETLFQVRRLMPETTLIVLEPEFSNTDDYDLVLKLHDGRLQQDEATAERNRLDSTADFESKRRIIAGADVFSHLRPAQIRLLAYASHWVRVEAGDYLFRAGDFPDGAYILAEGVAQMRFAGSAPEAPSVTDVGPGRLIGDLSVILDRPRSMNLLAIRPVLALRLERRELLQIIDNDVMVATSLLRTVSGHLYEAAESIRVERYENDG